MKIRILAALLACGAHAVGAKGFDTRHRGSAKPQAVAAQQNTNQRTKTNQQGKPSQPTAEQTALASLFRDIFNKNLRSHVPSVGEPLIPLIIHQIWIGPKPLPEKFIWMMESWKAQHPEWEYKLWTNDDLKDFPFINKAAFDAAKNWGMKSDILRYEILYYFGGLYVDIDFECIKSFEPLHYAYDFYTGLLSSHEIANGLIAASQGSLVMAKAIEAIRVKFDSPGNHAPTKGMDIIQSTGPVFFTHLVAGLYEVMNHEQQSKIMTFPVNYFYAFPSGKRGDFWANRMKREQVLACLKPETMGIHYWATSWQ